jgi:hypothetical protein
MVVVITENRPEMHLVIQIALFCALALPVFGGAGSIPNYTVGDKARTTITTPIPLIVVDQEKTEALRQQEAGRIPAIYRYYPKAADEAENNLRSAFDNAREKFINLLQTNYNKRVLSPEALVQGKFERVQATFQKQQKTFPLTSDLAQIWAKGESDAAVQTEMAGKLRSVMSRYIRQDGLPAFAKLGTSTAKVVALPSPGYVLDLEAVEKQSYTTNKTNFLGINKFKKEYLSSYPSNEQAVANFIASFIKINLVADEELTRQARASHIDAIWAADNYEPGQVVVTSNETITPRIKAALDQLREKMAAEAAKAELTEEKLKAQNKAARFREQALLAKAEAQAATERNWWLAIGGGVVGIVVLVSVLFRLRRQPQSMALVSVPMVASHSNVPMLSQSAEGSMVISSSAASVEAPSLEADIWKERALEAEMKAEQLSTVVKAGLFPQLSRWLAQKFVSRLVLERSQLLDTQHRAELAIAEIECRLEEVRAPLEERLRVYEQRIEDLEAQLAAKAAENQELIKATILAARKKLEEERSKGSLINYN